MPEAANPACQVSSCAERDMGFDTSDNCLLGRPRALDAMLAQVRLQPCVLGGGWGLRPCILNLKRSMRLWRRLGL